jgi:hypothetical protein
MSSIFQDYRFGYFSNSLVPMQVYPPEFEIQFEIA